ILTLIENGYYIEGTDFEPNAQITQEGFLRYLYAPEQRYYGDADAFYRMLTDRGVVKAGERDADAALTRYDAAKFVVRHLGLQRIAEHPEVFVNAFNDEAAAEYGGYAAIVKALSIMRGDAAGNFNGTRILTNAEAAVVIHNTLEAQ
ncbi:MAG: S-layer protein, partial [Clostridiales Family XIII bacterium]|nr:S-layer protein [Clostridiales Family XIII bacterium]